MVDFSQLLGANPTGLLTPEQEGNVNQNFLQALAAGMMKASGPSPYKAGMTTLSGLGEALQGGLAARRAAQQDAVTQSLARVKMLEGLGPLLQRQANFQSLGMAMPPNEQRLLDTLIHTALGGRDVPGAPGAASGTPAAPGVTTPSAAGAGPRAEATPTTSADVTGSGPGTASGFKLNFLRQMAREIGLDDYAATPGAVGHELVIDHAKRRAADMDVVHQRTLTEQKAQDKRLDPILTEIQDLRALGQPIPERITAALRDIGVDEKIIKRITTGTEAPTVKSVKTETVSPAATVIAGGIGTPPVPTPPAPAEGLPPTPAPIMPSPAATPPPSPLRVTGAGAGSFLPPPAGALPPLPPTVKPPALAVPPTAAPASPVVPPTPPVEPPTSPAAKATAAMTETADQRTQRLKFPLDAQAKGHPLHAAWEKAFNADVELMPKMQEEAIRDEIKSMGKEYAGIQALGRVSAHIHNLTQEAQAIMARPDFESTTGFGADTKLLVNRLLIGMGIKPTDAAFSAGAFNKIFSEALQDRIEAAKADAAELGPAGRQYLAQLNIMAKASPSIDHTLAENQFLVDKMGREARKNMKVADAATDYAQSTPTGSLDKGWNKVHIALLASPEFNATERATMLTKEPMGPSLPPQSKGSPKETTTTRTTVEPTEKYNGQKRFSSTGRVDIWDAKKGEWIRGEEPKR